MNGSWLAGFIDGEGCFCLEVTNKRTYPTFACRMIVALRADDYEVLRAAQAWTGIGRLNYKIVSPANSPNAKPQWKWTVSQKVDCQALCAILDKYPLQTKKSLDYTLWREAVLLHATVQPGPVPSDPLVRARLFALEQELKDVRAYSPQFEPEKA